MARRVVVRVYLPGLAENVLEDLQAVFRRNPGSCPLVFELQQPGSFKAFVESPEFKTVAPTDALVKQIEAMLGEDRVIVEY
jgi:hypothetical protein